MNERMESLAEALEQQSTRSYALVAAARAALADIEPCPAPLAVALLDVAEDELADTEAILALRRLNTCDEA